MKNLLFLLWAFSALSCSDSSDSTPARPSTLVPIDGFDDDPIGLVKSLNIGFIDPVPHVTGYIKAIKRISMINTDSLDEEWSKEFSQDYDRAFHIPSIDGVFLVSKSEIRLVTKHNEKAVGGSEDADFTGERYARAITKSRYVAGTRDGSKYTTVVRQDNGGIIVAAIENVAKIVNNGVRSDGPYSNTSTIAANFAPLLDEDGDTLLFFEAQLGTYAYYKLGTDGRYGNRVKTCLPSLTGDGEPISEIPEASIENPLVTFTAAKLNAAGNLLVYGNETGKLGFIRISNDENCHRVDLSHTNDLDLGQKIERIIEGAEDTYYVSSGTMLKVIRYDGDRFILDSEYETGCEIPVASILLKEKFLLSSCLIASDPKQEVYDVSMTNINIETNEVLNTFLLTQSSIARISLDAEAMKLYLIRNNAFGGVIEKNLQTKAERKGPSFVLNRILDRL